MAELLKGKDAADALSNELAERVEALKKKGVEACLAILRLGENPSDLAYERGATKRAESVGVRVRSVAVPLDISEADLEKEILNLNMDKTVHGVLMMRPLPKHLDENRLRNMIVPEKDMDACTDLAMAGVFTGTDLGYPPCTAEAAVKILDFYGVDVKGKNVAVVGRSLVIGKPVSMMLLKKNATVTICHTKTENIADICKKADIIIAAAGSAKMITKDFVNEKQVIVDVGINFDENGKMVGDVNAEEVEPIVKAMTPVPGGVGAMTSTVLMSHVVKAAELAE